MKKCILPLLLAVMLLLSACHYLEGDHYYHTQKDDDYIFQIGEPVILTLFDEPSPWATLEIKNAIILTQEPVTVKSEYLSEPAQAIVQVNYIITNESGSSLGMSSGDLKCYDATGNYCPRADASEVPCEPVYTQYEYFWVAVPVKDSYIDVKLALESLASAGEEEYRRYATIRCYYGVGEVEVDASPNHTLTSTTICLVLASVVCFIVAANLFKHSKQLSRELDDLKVQYPPQPEPNAPQKPAKEAAQEPEAPEEATVQLPPPAQPLPLPAPAEDPPAERSDEQ